MSKIKIKIVNSNHFICNNICNKSLHPSIKKFWKSRRLDYIPSDKAVIALADGKVVGFFRFMIGTYTHYISIGALGTYILPKYRRLGLAAKMWSKALKKIKPAFIILTITSKVFIKFKKYLEKKYPTTIFYTALRL